MTELNIKICLINYVSLSWIINWKIKETGFALSISTELHVRCHWELPPIQLELKPVLKTSFLWKCIILRHLWK